MKKQVVFLLMAFVALAAFRTRGEPEGKKVYEIHCLRCHGIDGSKKPFGGGRLARSELNDAGVMQVIRNGKGLMPSFGKTLTESEIRSLLIYVKSFRKTKP